MSVLGEASSSQNTNTILSFIKSNYLFILAVSVGGPILEEFVFRRALIGLLETKIPLWFAVIVSSLVFAIIHDDGHILLYTALGLVFSMLYIKTGRIWTSIISHVGMNTLVVVVSLFMT
ncbi:CAAX amino terminal protease [Enterococcus italicus DSM 15952]|nr:CAAX amino terminal protease [Enterococcus italicus DSM 15952]